jgi:hypothetical protein
MTSTKRYTRMALLALPLAIGGCSAMGGQTDGSPTNGGVTQTTGLGSNGPSSGSGGSAAAAASHG